MAHPGLQALFAYPLLEAIFNRRSRRVAKGLGTIRLGSLTHQSNTEPEPLSPLEEAVLIAVTGITGMTMPDSATEDKRGNPILGTPLLELRGRAASSPDNAQATHVFMINDSGTYLLRPPQDMDPFLLQGDVSEQALLDLAERSKVKILDKRVDFPREFPAYFDRNRQLSNVPGSTVFVPVVDMTRQYINAVMYLLSQPDGQRPAFLDEWNFYRWAGCKPWVKKEFLNKDIKVPLGVAGTMRTPFEALLILQNLMLTIQAIGLGGWIHASPIPAVLLGDPDFREKFGAGLGFRFVKPELGWLRRLWRMARIPITPLPAWRANPVGLPGVLEGFTPPNYSSMTEAFDALLALKYGKDGLYSKPENLAPVFKDNFEETFLAEAPHYTPEVVDCARAICNYIYDTYGRFPAHCDAMHVPGVYVQAHVLDTGFYDALFVNGYTASQAAYQQNWRSGGDGG